MIARAGQSGMQAGLKLKEKQLAERDQMIGELTVANRIQMNFAVRPLIDELHRLIETSSRGVRMAEVLRLLGISRLSWYSKPKGGRMPVPIDPTLRSSMVACAEQYLWWGYKRIAVVCRYNGLRVSDKVVYRVMRDADLLQRRVRIAEIYQTVKFFELLPSGPTQL